MARCHDCLGCMTWMLKIICNLICTRLIVKLKNRKSEVPVEHVRCCPWSWTGLFNSLRWFDPLCSSVVSSCILLFGFLLTAFIRVFFISSDSCAFSYKRLKHFAGSVSVIRQIRTTRGAIPSPAPRFPSKAAGVLSHPFLNSFFLHSIR